ncbi:MAG: tRNA (adenosine(37)-N6)-dimethylallyltransferase MiaA [Alphaproteobacteria bacterium]|nr:tRNA (adenosine(37)-N6)-dimethylallyltransferase MiaA [Alphaproteobacteria bacterium]
MTVTTPPLLLIAGPTASGKSGLALTLAERLRGTVINADSMQVYRELRVLTARPSTADLERAPHALYGVQSVAEPSSAGRWRGLAVAAIAAARAGMRVPIVVGGTGLYLRALMGGLAPVPVVPAAIRAAARAHIAELGAAAFHAALVARDPTAAALRASDRQRVVRAWEVLEATGRPLSAWQADPSTQAAPPPPHVSVLLLPPRAQVYAACAARFDAMLAAGALEEARQIAALGRDPALPAMRALGLRPLLAHLAGALTLDEAIARAKTETRQYAKRQYTWFRHQWRAELTLATPAAKAVLAALARSGRD